MMWELASGLGDPFPCQLPTRELFLSKHPIRWPAPGCAYKIPPWILNLGQREPKMTFGESPKPRHKAQSASAGAGAGFAYQDTLHLNCRSRLSAPQSGPGPVDIMQWEPSRGIPGLRPQLPAGSSHSWTIPHSPSLACVSLP